MMVKDFLMYLWIQMIKGQFSYYMNHYEMSYSIIMIWLMNL